MGRLPKPPLAPAPLLVVAAVASVQSGAAIATTLFPKVGAGGAVLLRLGIAAVVLVPATRPSLRGRGRREVALAVAFGGVLAAMNFSFYQAIDRVPLGVAVTVEMVGPLVVAVIGSRTRLDLVWVGSAAAGVLLLTSTGGAVRPSGIALAATAGAFWGLYIILAQRVGRVFAGASGLAVALVVATVVVVPVGVVDGGRGLLAPDVLAMGAGVALLSSAVPYSLEITALRSLSTAVFGVLMSLEPAVAALSGWVFLGQHLLPREWLAIGCVVVASAGVTLAGRRETATPEPGSGPSTPADAAARR